MENKKQKKKKKKKKKKKRVSFDTFDIKFIRLDLKQVGVARQAFRFLGYFWSRLINMLSKDTSMVLSIYSLYFECYSPFAKIILSALYAVKSVYS